LLFNHSHRVFFFASAQGDAAGLKYDPELLFICAAFHDLGLVKKYKVLLIALKWSAPMPHASFLRITSCQRHDSNRLDAIALHTTPNNTVQTTGSRAFYTGVGPGRLGEV